MRFDLDYIINLCRPNNISVKVIVNKYGGDDILLTHRRDTYKVQQEDDCYILLKRNCAQNPKRREYYHLVKNAGDNGKFYSLKDLIFGIIK